MALYFGQKGATQAQKILSILAQCGLQSGPCLYVQGIVLLGGGDVNFVLSLWLGGLGSGHPAVFEPNIAAKKI